MKERGAALVETAIVIPLWIILCFGLVDLSRMIKVYAAADRAASEAVVRGSRFQCSANHITHEITVCDVALPMPAEPGRTDFGSGPTFEQYTTCLSNNGGPDCGRIIMASSARLIMKAMAPQSAENTRVAVEIVHAGKYSRVEVSAQFWPLFKILGPATVTAVSVGPYGTVIQ